jgi:hypothetical protein
MDELVGIADAAGAPFHALAVLNLRNEIRQTTSFDTIHGGSSGERYDHCSDYLIWTQSAPLQGQPADSRRYSDTTARPLLIHNEDGAPYSRNRAFLLRAELFASAGAGAAPPSSRSRLHYHSRTAARSPAAPPARQRASARA